MTAACTVLNEIPDGALHGAAHCTTDDALCCCIVMRSRCTGENTIPFIAKTKTWPSLFRLTALLQVLIYTVWKINAKIRVEVYLCPKRSSHCLQEGMSLKQFVYVPTFVQIGRIVCGTQTKCNFSTSKCAVCIASVFTNLRSFSDFTRRLIHRTSPSSIKKYKFMYTSK